MPVETIRLSQKARGQLIKVKRDTQIMQWNILCRWALCISLSEQSVPATADIPSDSSVEMSWKVFGGKYADVYWTLVKQRCHEDGLGTDDETLAAQFRLHLHRGISYLAADSRIKSITEFMGKVSEIE